MFCFCGAWGAGILEYREAARHAGGGFVNHDLFWNVLSPWGGHPPGPESDTIQARLFFFFFRALYVTSSYPTVRAGRACWAPNLVNSYLTAAYSLPRRALPPSRFVLVELVAKSRYEYRRSKQVLVREFLALPHSSGCFILLSSVQRRPAVKKRYFGVEARFSIARARTSCIS